MTSPVRIRWSSAWAGVAPTMQTATPNNRIRACWLALMFLMAAVVWLIVNAQEDGNDRLFFGLWRTRVLAIGVSALYLSLLSLSYAFSKRTAYTLVLGVLMTCATIALLELVGAVGAINYARAFGLARSETLGTQAVPHLDVTGQTYQDLALKRGYLTEPIPFHYVTDRRGFRNEHDRADADIYLLGDSILVAGLLPFQKTVAGLLEEEMGVRAMNIALIGLSPQEERDLFIASKLPIRDRLVLHFVFEGNDLLDSASYRKPTEALSSLAQSTFCYNFMIWLQKLSDPRKLADERKVGRIDGKEFLFSWTDRSFRGVEGEFEYVCAALREMHSHVTAAKGAYAIVYVPAKIRVLGPFCTWPPESSVQDYKPHLSPMRKWLADWCQDQGLDMLDLTDPLVASVGPDTIPWFPADTHPNEVGHRVVADAIELWNVAVAWRERFVKNRGP